MSTFGGILSGVMMRREDSIMFDDVKYNGGPGFTLQLSPLRLQTAGEPDWWTTRMRLVWPSKGLRPMRVLFAGSLNVGGYIPGSDRMREPGAGLKFLQRLATGKPANWVEDYHAIQLRKEDAEVLAVWMDEQLAAGTQFGGLRGLGAVERRAAGRLVTLHFPNVEVKRADGVMVKEQYLSDVCHMTGIHTAWSIITSAIANAKHNIRGLRAEGTLLRRHILDEEGDSVEARIDFEQRRVVVLRNTLGAIQRELSRGMTLNTPICFASDKMTKVHETTHGFFSTALPMPKDERLLPLRAAVERTAIKSFLHRTGPASKKYFDDFGESVRLQHTEEIFTGLMGMTAAVRMARTSPERARVVAREVAVAFATYLQAGGDIIDKDEVQQVMWASAKELVAKYRSDTALLMDFAHNDLSMANAQSKGVTT